MAQGLGQQRTIAQPALPCLVRTEDSGEDRQYRHPTALNDVGPLTGQFEPGVEESSRPGVDLMSLMAHQLLTPLAQIDTAAQKMARGAEDMEPAEIRARAARIRSATGRLSALVGSLMARARLDQQGPIRQVCSAVDLIRQSCEPIRQAQPGRLFWIEVEVENLTGDPLFLEQLLTILICNAAKYSAIDTVIGIEVAEISTGVTVSVSDHGVGISAEDCSRLFEPYFRGSNAAGTSGTGMGLHLARRIADAHGGTITVQSLPGEGSTFTVELPRG